MKYIFIPALLFLFFFAAAQNNFNCFVKDAVTKENLYGVTAAIAGTKRARYLLTPNKYFFIRRVTPTASLLLFPLF